MDIAVERVEGDDLLALLELGDRAEILLVDLTRSMKIRGVVEKPSPEAAPSNMAIVGRYILSPAIFDCIESLNPGIGGEIQLTDGIACLLKLEQVMAYRYHGKHYDCGSKVGFLEATVAFGLKHPEVGSEFRDILLRMGRQLLQEEASNSDFVDEVEAHPAILKTA